MDKTFALDDMFKFSSKLESSYDGFALTIDNLYEDPEKLYDWINSQSFPFWKYNPERGESSNSKVYNDCGLVYTVAHPTRTYYNEMDRILNLCREYWWKHDYDWQRIYEVNCFQTITEFDPKMQHYPHIDSAFNTPDNKSTLNMLVYLDKEENGGTAVYDGEWITNDERIHMLYPVEERFTIERIIPSKFNRCVIFPGNRLHGGYIEDYEKYSGEGWRFTQVQFFIPQ